MNYTEFHTQLLIALKELIERQYPFNESPLEDLDQQFLDRVTALLSNMHAEEEGLPLGAWVITSIINRYPHITPLVPRDLLWFFGGECMHFLGDEEVEQFQKLQDLLYADSSPETANYEQIRNQHLGLH